jgi:hypothetical protein
MQESRFGSLALADQVFVITAAERGRRRPASKRSWGRGGSQPASQPANDRARGKRTSSAPFGLNHQKKKKKRKPNLGRFQNPSGPTHPPEVRESNEPKGKNHKLLSHSVRMYSHRFTKPTHSAKIQCTAEEVLSSLSVLRRSAC